MSNLQRLNNSDIRALRPWFHNGKSFVTLKQGEDFVNVETDLKAHFTKDQWVYADRVLSASVCNAMPITDFLIRNLCMLKLDDGKALSTIVLQEQVVTGEETYDSEGRPQPKFDTTLLPLPIISEQIGESSKVTSQNIRTAAASVGETIEDLVLGFQKFDYGGGRIRGMIDCLPPTVFPNAYHAMNDLRDHSYYGPFVLIRGKESTIDYPDAKKVVSTRMLTSEALVCQFTPDVIRVIVGLEPTLVQWGEEDYRIIAIIVPQLRTAFDSSTHGRHGVARISTTKISMDGK